MRARMMAVAVMRTNTLFLCVGARPPLLRATL